MECALIFLVGTAGGGARAGAAPVNVSEYHNGSSRSGVYVDPAFTLSAATNLTRDTNFSGVISGNVYAQPLYIENGPGGRAMIIAATESNNVYALDAINGSVLWQTNVGAPVPLSKLPCGDVDPLGITGTPVVDLASRSLFLGAMTTPDGGTTRAHKIFSLNVDSGSLNAGWTVDLNSKAQAVGRFFSSPAQGQRGALTIFNNILYVPYGGVWGDCGTYYGWLIGVPLGNSSNVMAWATPAAGGGAWSVGGVASDGVNVFMATGNTFGASTWGGGEAIIRFSDGPVFSNASADFWTPANWSALDGSDTDLGGSGPLPVDVPGATPSKLIVALGKDGNAYLLNRTNLGGISAPVAQAHLSSSVIIQAAATYRTALGTHVVFRGKPIGCSGGTPELGAFIIGAANPPTIALTWCATQNGSGSPFVTSTDGTNNFIVWGIGAEGDQRLHGFNGDTGAVVFGGGGTNELMTGTRRFSTGIAARGRIYVAADKKVYAFKLPVAPIILSQTMISTNGAFQFTFNNIAGASFHVFAASSLSAPPANWVNLGNVAEASPGQYQFTDALVTNRQMFYRVMSP